MKKLIIGLLLCGQISLACNKPVTYLQQGNTAPCNGYLFSPEKELEVREQKLKFEDMQKIVEKQDELEQVLKQRIYTVSEQNNNLRSQVNSLEEKSLMDKIVYFGLGILLGVTAVKTISK